MADTIVCKGIKN